MRQQHLGAAEVGRAGNVMHVTSTHQGVDVGFVRAAASSGRAGRSRRRVHRPPDVRANLKVSAHGPDNMRVTLNPTSCCRRPPVVPVAHSSQLDSSAWLAWASSTMSSFLVIVGDEGQAQREEGARSRLLLRQGVEKDCGAGDHGALLEHERWSHASYAPPRQRSPVSPLAGRRHGVCRNGPRRRALLANSSAMRHLPCPSARSGSSAGIRACRPHSHQKMRPLGGRCRAATRPCDNVQTLALMTEKPAKAGFLYWRAGLQPPLAGTITRWRLRRPAQPGRWQPVRRPPGVRWRDASSASISSFALRAWW